MSVWRIPFRQPHWYLLGAGLVLVGAGFVFASQTFVIYSRTFFINAAVYILLQVSGWVLVIEWLRTSGHLTAGDDG